MKEYYIGLIDESGEVVIDLSGKIDLISSLSATRSSKVTSVPVEDGRSVSDHVVDMPVTLDIDAVVSNIWYDGIEKGRPESTYTLLVEMKKRRSLFVVQSMVGIFDNMLISDLSHTESSETGTSLHIKISMTEMKFAISKESFEVFRIRPELIVKDGEDTERQKFIKTCVESAKLFASGKPVFRDADGIRAWKPREYQTYEEYASANPITSAQIPNNPLFVTSVNRSPSGQFARVRLVPHNTVRMAR